MTTLQWMTSFDHMHVQSTGRVGDVCWMHAFAWNVGEPGATPQYFVIERGSALRVISDFTDAECAVAKADPLTFWERGAAR